MSKFVEKMTTEYAQHAEGEIDSLRAALHASTELLCAYKGVCKSLGYDVDAAKCTIQIAANEAVLGGGK